MARKHLSLVQRGVRPANAGAVEPILTILGAAGEREPRTSEERGDARRFEQQAWDRCVHLVEFVLLPAYKSREITFAQFCEMSVQATDAFHRLVPETFRSRRQLLGWAVEEAVKADPPTKRRQMRSSRGNPGEPQFLRAIACELVGVVKRREGAKLSREPAKGPSAFVRAREVLRRSGLHATASQIERWWNELDERARTQLIE